MNIIFHITKQEQWGKAIQAKFYRSETFDSEGFIHCSKLSQIPKVANTFFVGQSKLVLLYIDSARVEAEIKYELADGDSFPHIYGSLNIDSVVKVIDFLPNEHGIFELPEDI